MDQASRKWWMIGLAATAAVCATPLLGDDATPAPGTQPADRRSGDANQRGRERGERGDRPDRERAERGRGGDETRGDGATPDPLAWPPRRSNTNWREEALPSEEEWQEIEAFMLENGRTRLEMYNKIVETVGPDRAQMARRRIAARYRALQKLKDSNPEFYQFMFRQMQVEDQVLTTLREMRGAAEGDETLQKKLTTQVQTYVENHLNERKARIERLKELIAKESQSLEQDRAKMPEMVQQQRERFEREMRRALDFEEQLGSGKDDKTPTTAPAK